MPTPLTLCLGDLLNKLQYVDYFSSRLNPTNRAGRDFFYSITPIAPTVSLVRRKEGQWISPNSLVETRSTPWSESVSTSLHRHVTPVFSLQNVLPRGLDERSRRSLFDLDLLTRVGHYKDPDLTPNHLGVSGCLTFLQHQQ